MRNKQMEPSEIEISQKKVGFDWSNRTSFSVLTLPFIEGVPSQEKALALTKWVKQFSDLYANMYVKMYHATAPNIPIIDLGLKPTTNTRRRSYQSTNGYVYLANTPQRAKNFGDIGNGGNSKVYEVIVPIRNLLSDLDQLHNQRSTEKDIGNSIGESIIYGGGARIKGAIEPWAIRIFNMDSELEMHDYLSTKSERNRKYTVLKTFKPKNILEKHLQTQFLKLDINQAIDPNLFDWPSFETELIDCYIKKEGIKNDVVSAFIQKFSPGVVTSEEITLLNRRITVAAAVDKIDVIENDLVSKKSLKM